MDSTATRLAGRETTSAHCSRASMTPAAIDSSLWYVRTRIGARHDCPRFAAERHRHRSLGGASAALAAMGRPREGAERLPFPCGSPVGRRRRRPTGEPQGGTQFGLPRRTWGDVPRLGPRNSAPKTRRVTMVCKTGSPRNRAVRAAFHAGFQQDESVPPLPPPSTPGQGFLWGGFWDSTASGPALSDSAAKLARLTKGGGFSGR